MPFEPLYITRLGGKPYHIHWECGCPLWVVISNGQRNT